MRRSRSLCSLFIAALAGCNATQPKITINKLGDQGGCVALQGGPDPWGATEDDSDVALPGDLGSLTLCEHSASLPGIEEYILQYISQSPPGVARHVTALLYAPSDGQAGHTLVALSHPTTGLGAACGPTHSSASTDNIALPMLDAGYAVIATDYPGMGVPDGISPYLVGEGEANSVLDSITAVSQVHDSLFDASQLSGQLFLAGHSQGGHSTLFTQQYFGLNGTLGAGPIELLGSISFAPALGDLRGIGSVIGNAMTPTLASPFLPLALWAAANYYDNPPDPTTWLTDVGEQLPGILASECTPALYAGLATPFPTLGSLLTPTFQSAASGCAFDGGDCPAFDPWTGWLEAAIPGNFNSSAPALILQGEADTTVLPETTACIAMNLANNGTPVQLCGYAGADHNGVVAAALPDALTWMAAVQAGQSPPTVCPAPLMESCTP